MKKKINKTNQIIKTWTMRAITVAIAICIGLVGMSILKVIDLPDVLIKFVGYLLIVSAVVYIFKNYK